MRRNCECVRKAEEAVLKKKIEVDNVSIQKDLVSGITYSECYEQLDTGKRRTTKIFHEYCPFCGKKYGIGSEVKE